jgi:small subunit ribosomal protein S6
MRRYESVVILDPDMTDEDIRGFTEKFSGLIKTKGGEIIKIEDWGFKRLAYAVKKRDRGRYILFDFVGLPSLMGEMERQFKISDEVMKFLSVKVEDEVDLEAFAAASKKPAVEPLATTVAEAAEPATESETIVPGEEAVQSPQEGDSVETAEAVTAPEQSSDAPGA